MTENQKKALRNLYKAYVGNEDIDDLAINRIVDDFPSEAALITGDGLLYFIVREAFESTEGEEDRTVIEEIVQAALERAIETE